MPHAAIHKLRNAGPASRPDILAAVNAAFIQALKVPVDPHPVRLSEYDRDAFLIPKDAGDGFMLIEATIFPGRSLATKQALYDAILDNLAGLGVERRDVRIVLVETPLENWALRGGTPASELDLGFEVAI